MEWIALVSTGFRMSLFSEAKLLILFVSIAYRFYYKYFLKIVLTLMYIKETYFNSFYCCYQVGGRFIYIVHCLLKLQSYTVYKRYINANLFPKQTSKVGLRSQYGPFILVNNISIIRFLTHLWCIYKH